MNVLPKALEKPISETAKVRELVVPALIHDGMQGIDVGFGGDKIHPAAIAFDLKGGPYVGNYAGDVQQVFGDCRNLGMFGSSRWDYVYSSHVLEDLPPTELRPTLWEWLRVLKMGGLLVLYLPDQKRYEAHCAARGKGSNPHHQNPDMSLAFMQQVFREMGTTEEVVAWDDVEGYSFLLAVQKVRERSDKRRKGRRT